MLLGAGVTLTPRHKMNLYCANLVTLDREGVEKMVISPGETVS